MELCMTASDLCAMFKPWQMQKDVVNIIMEEFWQQVNILPFFQILLYLVHSVSTDWVFY
jgi:hypothetical protein